MLQRGDRGTIPMTLGGLCAAMALEEARTAQQLPHDRVITLLDSSTITAAMGGAPRDGYRDGYGEELRRRPLADYHALLYGETWYQRYFGARPASAELEQRLQRFEVASVREIDVATEMIWRTHLSAASMHPLFQGRFDDFHDACQREPRPRNAREIALRAKDALGTAFVLQALDSILLAMGALSLSDYEWTFTVGDVADRVRLAKLQVTLNGVDVTNGRLARDLRGASSRMNGADSRDLTGGGRQRGSRSRLGREGDGGGTHLSVAELSRTRSWARNVGLYL